MKKYLITALLLSCFIFLNTWFSFSATTDQDLLNRIKNLEARIAKLEKSQEIKTNKLSIIDEKGREIICMRENKTDDFSSPEISLYNYNPEKQEALSISGSPYIIFGKPPIVLITEKSYIPNYTEWNLLKYVSENSNQRYLTDNLILTSVSANEDLQIRENLEIDLQINVNTAPQPIWEKYYLGNGKFNLTDREVRGEYLEAGNRIVREINNYVDTSKIFSHIIIHFAIRGSEVGTWTDGVMKLKGE